MKTTASIALLVATAACASAAALEPQATAAPLEKRQDAGAFQSALQQYSALLTIPAFQSIAASIAMDSAALSAAAAAQTGDVAPFQSYVNSLQANPTLSQAIVSALGTSSAAAIYSSIQAGQSSLSQIQTSASASGASGASSGGSGASSSAASSPSGSTTSSGSNAAPSMQAPLAAGLGLIGATAFVLALI
ncbi:hypothetical protein BDZ90DRAFT_233565 [Jaminaea rosea]|uniref:Uncharacterized protein n=1 Tax=Jaminaea rosea TaxID=1569628 RepID=A0A316UL32_9BASI|nr:hypothetical protein BDZ90DRAFT_233565 [Jaminaea rosea]PWN25967.1 hypothetical protein BDZ90DRAFT_233565 [Jaminaea rosea]